MGVPAIFSPELEKWLLTPLSVGATVVLCANLDRGGLDARVAAERVTKVV